MTECVSLTRYTAVLSSKAAAVPKPCRFWDWFWCSTVRYTKRRRPSASECNCWSNCRTNYPHASSESSYQGLWKLLERYYHSHPISWKLPWSVVRKFWGLVFYASCGSRSKVKRENLRKFGFLDFSLCDSSHNCTSWMLQNSEKYKRSSLCSLKPKINQKVLKTKEKHRKPLSSRCLGGDRRDRTADLLNAMGSMVYTK